MSAAPPAVALASLLSVQRAAQRAARLAAARSARIDRRSSSTAPSVWHAKVGAALVVLAGFITGCVSSTALSSTASPSPTHSSTRALAPVALVDGTRSSAAAAAWTWHVTFHGGEAIDVGSLETRLCFSGAPPLRVAPEGYAARRGLRENPALWTPMQGRGAPVPVDDDGIVTAGLSPGACVHFTVDLEGWARELQRPDQVVSVGRTVVASPDVWLWRPRPWPAGAMGSLVVDAAPSARGAQLAAPFARDGAAWRVPPSTYVQTTYAALGHFDEAKLVHDASVVDAIFLPGSNPLEQATLTRWLDVALSDVAVVFGRVPVTSLMVFIVPLAARRAVLAGFLGRGGGRAHALVLVGDVASTKDPDTHERGARHDHDREDVHAPQADADPDDEEDDQGRWVLTHELAHLLLPPVRREDAWLNEGLATWHQEMLPARAGRRTERSARARLMQGFATGALRAREDRLSLQEACAQMDARLSYQHCYWGGARLIELLVEDVGQGALDAFIAALNERAALDATPQRARALLHQVAVSGPPLAAQAARRLAALWSRFAHEPFPQVSSSSWEQEQAQGKTQSR
jgi:hypothetical protein